MITKLSEESRARGRHNFSIFMKSIEKEKREGRKRRHSRIRASVMGTANRPRLSVYRSNRGVQIQLIDDENARTLVSASSVKDTKQNPLEAAKEAGARLAKEAVKDGIKEVVFDRGGFAYHGRVKMVAEGAREGGLKF